MHVECWNYMTVSPDAQFYKSFHKIKLQLNFGLRLVRFGVEKPTFGVH
jgi:hypothetical protein